MEEYFSELRLRINEIFEKNNDNANSISDSPAMQRRISRQVNEGKDITMPTVKDILDIYQDVSADWLLRGQGDMCNKTTELPPVDVSSEESINHSAEVARLVKEKNALAEENQELREENERLQAEYNKVLAQLDYASSLLRERLNVEPAQKVG